MTVLHSAIRQLAYPVGAPPTLAPIFFRPPFILHARVTQAVPELQCMPEFFLIGLHARPARVYSELNGLVNAYDLIRHDYGQENALILGDFNADGTSFGDVDRLQNVLVTRQDFQWLIGDNNKTNTLGDKAYDRSAGVRPPIVVQCTHLLSGIYTLVYIFHEKIHMIVYVYTHGLQLQNAKMEYINFLRLWCIFHMLRIVAAGPLMRQNVQSAQVPRWDSPPALSDHYPVSVDIGCPPPLQTKTQDSNLDRDVPSKRRQNPSQYLRRFHVKNQDVVGQ